MTHSMRSILVAALVTTLTYGPAAACHYCGGYGGGGYHVGGGYGGYYTGCYSGGYGYTSGCCGSYYSDCGGCGSYDGCGCDGESTSHSYSEYAEPEMRAPEAPAHHPAPKQSTVNRAPSEPAPALPTYQEPTTPATPSDESRYALPSQSEQEPVTPAPTTPTPTTPEPSTTPAMEPPSTEPTPPAVEPQDDLFGPPSTDETPLPVEEPATPPEADDFFSAPSTDTTPSTPADPPATTTPPTADDLFGPPAEEETPAEEEEKPAEESNTFDDLFGKAKAILHMPGGLTSSENRHWVDNTGKFSCDGRMLRMIDGKVQILKSTGRTTTVPLARLSERDLEFVNRQASAQKAETMDKTAQVSSAWSN